MKYQSKSIMRRLFSGILLLWRKMDAKFKNRRDENLRTSFKRPMEIKEILMGVFQESVDIVHSFNGSLNKVQGMVTYLRLTKKAILQFDKNVKARADSWTLKHPDDIEKIRIYIEELREKLLTICGVGKK